MSIRPPAPHPLSPAPLPRRLYWRAKPKAKHVPLIPARPPHRTAPAGAAKASGHHKKLDIFV